LRSRGHDVVAADLPTDDDSAGLWEYAAAVVAATGNRRDVVLVAQSLAGFVAPLVCERVPVRLVVLVTAMVPRRGESPGGVVREHRLGGGAARGGGRDGREIGDEADVVTEFFHDVPADVVAEAFRRPEPVQAETPFAQPWPLDGWPDVPTRFVLCRHDRFFPADFMRHVVHERLGIEPDELASWHLPALSQPAALVRLLERFRVSVSA
jgi:Alpha/beta hydrolase family